MELKRKTINTVEDFMRQFPLKFSEWEKEIKDNLDSLLSRNWSGKTLSREEIINSPLAKVFDMYIKEITEKLNSDDSYQNSTLARTIKTQKLDDGSKINLRVDADEQIVFYKPGCIGKEDFRYANLTQFYSHVILQIISPDSSVFYRLDDQLGLMTDFIDGSNRRNKLKKDGLKKLAFCLGAQMALGDFDYANYGNFLIMKDGVTIKKIDQTFSTDEHEVIFGNFISNYFLFYLISQLGCTDLCDREIEKSVFDIFGVGYFHNIVKHIRQQDHERQNLSSWLKERTSYMIPEIYDELETISGFLVEKLSIADLNNAIQNFNLVKELFCSFMEGFLKAGYVVNNNDIVNHILNKAKTEIFNNDHAYRWHFNKLFGASDFEDGTLKFSFKFCYKRMLPVVKRYFELKEEMDRKPEPVPTCHEQSSDIGQTTNTSVAPAPQSIIETIRNLVGL